MRISLPYLVKQDFAERIAAALKLRLFTPAARPDPATGLLSDDQVIAQITDLIAEDGSLLLNGYPRNIIQAQSLDMALSQRGQALSAVLVRDTPKPLQNREKQALIRYYRSQNKLIVFDDTLSIDDICSKIVMTHEKRRAPAVVK